MTFVHNFGAPLPPPSQNSEVMDFLLNLHWKDLKQNRGDTAEMTNQLSQNFEQTDLQTNRRFPSFRGEGNTPENADHRSFLKSVFSAVLRLVAESDSGNGRLLAFLGVFGRFQVCFGACQLILFGILVAMYGALLRDSLSGPSRSEEENPPENPPKIKSSSEHVFLNNFRWVTDSCHWEEGKGSHELFENVRVNVVVFFW